MHTVDDFVSYKSSEVAGTFWKPAGEIIGPKGYGVFSSDKNVPIAEAFTWSNRDMIAVLAFTYGISTDRISATSRGILISKKLEQGNQEELKAMLEKSKEAAIKARFEDANQRRPIDTF
jgi:hypothetical protein